MDDGFKIGICLDDFMLEKQKPYSRAMAWVEIIQEAYISGGNFNAPERTLALRWGQTRHWVRTLIEHLEELGLITVEKESKFQTIKVAEIERYFSRSTNFQPIVNQSSTNMGTENQSVKQGVQPIVNQSATNQDKKEIKQEELFPLTIPFKEEINKEKTEEIKKKRKTINSRRKEKEDKKAEKLANLKKRKDGFYESLVPYVGKYTKEMVREFFDYWTEMNRSETHMKFELEQTWETGKRLATWAKNVRMKPKPINNMSIGVVLHNTDEDYEETRKQLW